MSEEDTRPTFLTEANIGPDELTEEDLGGLENLVAGVSETSQSTLLLRKRKQLREVDDALHYMKQNYRTRMMKVKQGQIEFLEKQKAMKEMVEKFEKFISDNDSKRVMREKKAQTEKKHRLQAEREVQDLRKKLATLEKEKEELEQKLSKLNKYEHYLDMVVAKSEEEYDNIESVLQRLYTLERTQKILKQSYEKNTSDMEELRSKLSTLHRDKQNAILMDNSKFQTLKEEVQQLQEEQSELAAKHEARFEQDRLRTMESAKVFMGIKNLYQRCVASMTVGKTKVEKAPKDFRDLDGMMAYLEKALAFVEMRITCLQAIVDEYQAEGPATPEDGKRDKTGKGKGAQSMGKRGSSSGHGAPASVNSSASAQEKVASGSSVLRE